MAIPAMAPAESGFPPEFPSDDTGGVVEVADAGAPVDEGDEDGVAVGACDSAGHGSPGLSWNLTLDKAACCFSSE